MNPPKQPKHMNLRTEDHQLLLHLHDYVYLPIQFIEKYIFQDYQSVQSLYRRLDNLEKNGYIKSFRLQVKDGDRNSSKVYTLTRFGVEEVYQLRGVVHWNNDWTHKVPNSYKHNIMIAEAVKSYELQAATVGLEVKEWITEQRAFYHFPLTAASTKSKTAIRPDGILVLGNPTMNTGYAHFIEMERSYSTKERTIKKIDQYNEFFSRKDELLEPYIRKVAFDHAIINFRVIFIGGTPAKTEKLLRELADEKPLVPIIVASADDVQANPFGTIYRDTRNPDTFITL